MRFFFLSPLFAAGIRLAYTAIAPTYGGPCVDLGYENYVGIQDDTFGLNIFRG